MHVFFKLKEKVRLERKMGSNWVSSIPPSEQHIHRWVHSYLNIKYFVPTLFKMQHGLIWSHFIIHNLNLMSTFSHWFGYSASKNPLIIINQIFFWLLLYFSIHMTCFSDIGKKVRIKTWKTQFWPGTKRDTLMCLYWHNLLELPYVNWILENEAEAKYICCFWVLNNITSNIHTTKL